MSLYTITKHSQIHHYIRKLAFSTGREHNDTNGLAVMLVQSDIKELLVQSDIKTSSVHNS
uniref:Uncharacterized protein n=1 Tax=Arundo donax TaxID=35708 RepID=A0A0A8XUK7_ARUDO